MYTDYLLKNFGNTNLKGFAQLNFILSKCNKYDNICKIYDRTDKVFGKGSASRNIEAYITKTINQIGLEKVEEILGCKADKKNKFSNKAFITAIKLRANETN